MGYVVNAKDLFREVDYRRIFSLDKDVVDCVGDVGRNPGNNSNISIDCNTQP